MNTFGNIFRLTDFGESHGPAMGGIIDGVPPCFRLDLDLIQKEVDARRPGQSNLTTARKEADKIEWLSGLDLDGTTLGTPIGFIIRNTDHRSIDYAEMTGKYRPNHADYTYVAKYGIHDWRGGGRSSARQTVCRVVAGAVALQLLNSLDIHISAHLDSSTSEAKIAEVKLQGDSIGGLVHCSITGMPPGIGSPVYKKFHAMLGAAMLGINGVKGFDYGLGFHAANARGSETADLFVKNPDGKIGTITNFSGGIQGGITNGEEISMRVAFKPTPTIMQPLATIDVNGNETVLESHGRHDPCIALRGVPVVKAMAAMVCVDALLAQGYKFKHQ